MNVYESHKVYENTLRNKVSLNFKICYFNITLYGYYFYTKRGIQVNPNPNCDYNMSTCKGW